jgi:hypothetical protein
MYIASKDRPSLLDQVLDQVKSSENPLLNQLLSSRPGNCLKLILASRTHTYTHFTHITWFSWFIRVFGWFEGGPKVVQGRSTVLHTTGRKKVRVTDVLSVSLAVKNNVIIRFTRVESRKGTILGTAFGEFVLC